MPSLLLMPGAAAQDTSGMLTEWLVLESGEFGAGDTIATVETEKALVDVSADSPGVLVRRLASPGAAVDVGAPIALLGGLGEEVGDVDAALRELGVTEPEAASVGLPAPPAQAGASPAPTVEPHGSPRRVASSPLARSLATEAGIPLGEIPGTGPGGRVIRRDVEGEVERRSAAPGADDDRTAAHTDTPHSRIRQITAERLTWSRQHVPHFSLRATVRAEALLTARDQLNDGAVVPITLTDLIVKAVGVAHSRVPALNVCWTPEAMRAFDTADVAVAVATDRGLLTPVVRDVAARTVTSIAEEVRDLGDRARTGRLKQEELEGGSITVSNLGMYAVEEFTAIINPPHAAVLAVGAVREEPVVEDGTVVPGTVLGLTLSVDHRPVDGVIAARWLAEFTTLLQQPVRLLA